jgi:RND family efflux transporter MFP subunit
MNRIVIMTAALVWSTYAISCGNSGSSKKENSDPKENVVFVKTQKIQLADFAETINLTGSIESTNDIVVPAEESGRVVEWFVDKGSTVSKGQVMARLDDALIKAGFDAAEANFKMAEVNYEKQKKAYDEQAVSELQLKNLEYQRDAARAQSDMARKRLDHTKIVAPVDGVINERYVDEGEMIGAGMPAAHVIDVHRLKIALGIPERYASRIHTGMTIWFSIDAFPGETFSGKIGYVGAAVNVDNRTIPAEVYFQNSGSRLKPHMIARVTLQLSLGIKAVAIPQDYIQLVDIGRSVVYVAKNGRALERVVKPGGTNGRQIQILEGLAEGDELIVAGYQNLANDQPISIQN